jgi:mannosidase alpha-like ER degradation enhancer 2
MNTTSHISGGIDSYYEYLLKAWLLFDDKDCKKMWETSIKAVNKYLADSTRTGLWYSQVDMNTGKQISTHYGGLDTFFPAVLARSGDLDHARKLQESSYKMWTTFGIEPEEMDYSTMKLVTPGYALRPEIIESAYYLQFYTKDQRYQEMGSTFILSLVRHCKTDAGYASLSNVETKTKKDIMESYFLAETLKYLYLLFAPRETLDLDKVVFNTEAHPLRKTW